MLPSLSFANIAIGEFISLSMYLLKKINNSDKIDNEYPDDREIYDVAYPCTDSKNELS